MTQGLDLETAIKELSPERLELYKRQLVLKTKSLQPEQLDAVLERIKGIPELSDIVGYSQPTQPTPQVQPAQEVQPSQIPLWQQALNWPLKQLGTLSTMAGATLTYPFRKPPSEWLQGPFGPAGYEEYQEWKGGPKESYIPLGIPSQQQLAGFLPSWAQTGLAKIQGKLPEQYKLWANQPGYQMGKLGFGDIAEFAPWMFTGGFGVAGKLPKPGQMLQPPKGLFGLKAPPPQALTPEKATPLMTRWAGGEATKAFSVPTNEMLEKTITKDDWLRRIAHWFGRKPVFKNITEAVGGKAATVGTTQSAEDVTARALLVGARVQETLLNSRNAQLATLREIHPDPIRLFGVDEATGIATRVEARVSGASKVMADIAEHPNNYYLNATQRAYIKEVHAIEDKVLAALEREGVDVRQLTFDEFSHWVHRVVKGKRVDGKLVELAKRGFGRIGSKQSFEKTRFYETAAEGLQQGVVYSGNLEQSVDLYIQSAAKRISDQRIANIVAPLGIKPTERLSASVAEKATSAAKQYAGIRNFQKVVNRAIRGETPTEMTLKAQESRFPELGAKLRESIGNPQKLNSLIKEAKSLEPTLKAEYWQARAGRVKAMEIARQPSLGTEATIAHPAFQGKIYPKEVADTINKYWADRGWIGFQKVSQMSSTMRTLVAAADFSAMFIQGLPGMFLHPRAWAKGAIMSFRAFLSPKAYQEYLVKELPLIQERIFYGGYAGGFEYMEAMGGLQRAAKVLAGKPGQAAIRQTYGRFEASFGAFGDVARNEMWKGLRTRTTNESELFEIARHLDRMTGVMSSKGLGIGASQREFESAFLFFAPRYTRANFALISDLFKGGLTGAESRKAIASMMAGGAAFYTGICLALGQEPNFDPSTGRFMTIEITDPLTGTKRHFGIGGMMTSLARLGADVTASITSQGANEPLDFVKLSRFDNPFLKFMYGKSAPATGFAVGMFFEQKNYFGEPFENIGDYAKFMVEQVIPIAAQSMFMEEGGLGPSTIVAEEAGLRTFPQSDWEKRDEIRDQVAQAKYGMSWNDVGTKMGKLYQLQLERESPELQEATQRAQETSSKMARGEGIVWDDWRKEGEIIEQRYQKSITLAAQEFDVTGDGTTFREKVNDASLVRREAYAAMKQNPDYTEVYQYFNEPPDFATQAKMNPKDIARQEYYQMMYSDDMYDQYGNYRFDEADRREAQFLQKYGQSYLDYIKDYVGAKWNPPAGLQILRKAQDILQPYWDAEDKVWVKYPPDVKQLSDQVEALEKTNPQQAKLILFNHPYGRAVLYARKLIALYRKQMKLRNPEMASALALFYRY